MADSQKWSWDFYAPVETKPEASLGWRKKVKRTLRQKIPSEALRFLIIVPIVMAALLSLVALVFKRWQEATFWLLFLWFLFWSDRKPPRPIFVNVNPHGFAQALPGSDPLLRTERGMV